MTPVTLALDLATKTGFAIVRADGRIESGMVKIAPRANEGEGQRWVRFRAWLVEMKAANPELGRLVYEEITFIGSFGGQPNSGHWLQIYGGMKAILQAFGEHHRIPYGGVNVSRVKKAWTGKGNAKKPEMIARCKELGFRPEDDNEADAIALLHVALDRVPALPLERQVKKRPLKPNPDKASREIVFDPF
jgi:crossover junction endodeoxyribonuclease RuvC